MSLSLEISTSKILLGIRLRVEFVPRLSRAHTMTTIGTYPYSPMKRYFYQVLFHFHNIKLS